MMKITYLLPAELMMLSMAGHRLQLRNGRNCIIPPTAAECAVIGINDALKGQILALVVTKIDSIEHFQLNKIKLVSKQIALLL
jgi:propionyl-CoA synthetase